MNNGLGASEHHHKVLIHIDRQPYEVESPIAAETLYEVAKVEAHRELVQEHSGPEEDTPIPRSKAELILKKNEHFYSVKESKIVVNAKKKETIETKLTFEELIHLAFEGAQQRSTTQYTITYRNGPKHNPQGTLTSGHTVRIKNGMIFNVTSTDKS